MRSPLGSRSSIGSHSTSGPLPESVEPAVSGHHGDLRTFRVCCRVVRGFDLSDDEAMEVLTEWNARCAPPWSNRELREKVHNARRYGQEPIGALLG